MSLVHLSSGGKKIQLQRGYAFSTMFIKDFRPMRYAETREGAAEGGGKKEHAHVSTYIRVYALTYSR